MAFGHFPPSLQQRKTRLQDESAARTNSICWLAVLFYCKIAMIIAIFLQKEG